MLKAEKGGKDIVKIVHVASVVQHSFHKATRILFVCKENKTNDFIRQFLLFRVSLRHAFMRVPQRMQVVKNKLLNKVVIFVFFAHKKVLS